MDTEALRCKLNSYTVVSLLDTLFPTNQPSLSVPSIMSRPLLVLDGDMLIHQRRDVRQEQRCNDRRTAKCDTHEIHLVVRIHKAQARSVNH